MDDEVFVVDLLGKLKIIEVYYFYDEPQLFSCINGFGQKYLCMLTDMDEREWIALPISSSKLAFLKSNKISVLEAIINSEEGFVWKVTEKNSDIKSAVQLYINDIPEEDLPDSDLYLDCDDIMMPSLNDKIVQLSEEERRDIIDLSLLPLNKHIREIEFQTLGEVLLNIQQVIYSLALDKDFNGNRISNKLKEDNGLSAVGTYAASFGIRAKSNRLSDLYSETPLTKTIRELTKLLEVKDNKTELKRILRQMNPRVILRYKKLMECLSKEQISFNIALASPNNYYFKSEFNQNEIQNTLKYLIEDVNDTISKEEKEGTLVGVNVNKKVFSFKSDDGELICGSICNELSQRIFNVPEQVKVTLEKETILSDMTDEEKYKYKLIAILQN